MTISINYNNASETCKNTLNKTIASKNDSLEKLITGCSVNSSKDDAAGFAISNKLDVDIKSSQQAVNNVQFGISYTELANKSIKIMQANVQRLRDLAQQASNEMVIDSSRAFMQTEVDLILEETLRTKNTTNFNGINVFGKTQTPLGETFTNINIQVGIEDNQNSTINIETGFDFESIDIDLSSVDTSKVSLGVIDDMNNTLTQKSSNLGADSNRLDTALDSLLSQINTLSSVKSMITDADIAIESANYVKYQILETFGSHLLGLSNSSSERTLNLISNSATDNDIPTSVSASDKNIDIPKSSANSDFVPVHELSATVSTSRVSSSTIENIGNSVISSQTVSGGVSSGIATKSTTSDSDVVKIGSKSNLSSNSGLNDAIISSLS